MSEDEEVARYTGCCSCLFLPPRRNARVSPELTTSALTESSLRAHRAEQRQQQPHGRRVRPDTRTAPAAPPTEIDDLPESDQPFTQEELMSLVLGSRPALANEEAPNSSCSRPGHDMLVAEATRLLPVSALPEWRQHFLDVQGASEENAFALALEQSVVSSLRALPTEPWSSASGRSARTSAASAKEAGVVCVGGAGDECGDDETGGAGACSVVVAESRDAGTAGSSADDAAGASAAGTSAAGASADSGGADAGDATGEMQETVARAAGGGSRGPGGAGADGAGGGGVEGDRGTACAGSDDAVASEADSRVAVSHDARSDVSDEERASGDGGPMGSAACVEPALAATGGDGAAVSSGYGSRRPDEEECSLCMEVFGEADEASLP